MSKEFRVRNEAIRLDADKASPTHGADEIRGIGGKKWSYASECYSAEDLILLSGSDAEALDPAVTNVTGGVVRLVTGNADGTVAADGSAFNIGAVQLDATVGVTVMEAKIRIATAITTVSVFVGLTDSPSLEEPFTNATDTISLVAADAVGFHFDSAATTKEWWMAAVDTGTADTGNAALGVAPVADTWQVLRLEVGPLGNDARFYIDGAYVGQLIAAGVGPDVVLYPTILANSTTTTSKTVDVDWFRISGERA